MLSNPIKITTAVRHYTAVYYIHHTPDNKRKSATIPPTNIIVRRKSSSGSRHADMDIESVPDVLNGSGEDLNGLSSAAEVDKLMMKSPVNPGKLF